MFAVLLYFVVPLGTGYFANKNCLNVKYEYV